MSLLEDCKALTREKGVEEGWWQSEKWRWTKDVYALCPNCQTRMEWVGISSKGEALFVCKQCGNCEFITKEEKKKGRESNEL